MAEHRVQITESVDLEGWTMRTTIDEPRLSELVELYEELGLEVMLRPVSAAVLSDQCSECIMADQERYRTIYTREKGENGRSRKVVKG